MSTFPQELQSGEDMSVIATLYIAVNQHNGLNQQDILTLLLRCQQDLLQILLRSQTQVLWM